MDAAQKLRGVRLSARMFPNHVCVACGDVRADHRLVNENARDEQPDGHSREVLYRNTNDGLQCRFRSTELDTGDWSVTAYRTAPYPPETNTP